MSADPWGAYGRELCDVCGRRNSWGCGHSGSQRSAARRHKATRKHRIGACNCTWLGRYGLTEKELAALSPEDRAAAEAIQAERVGGVL